MIDRHTEIFNRGSIFGGKEQWRYDEGFEQGKEADLKYPEPKKGGRNTPRWIEGWLEGRDAKKRQMMEDLIMGKYDEDETDDIKDQLGIPII